VLAKLNAFALVGIDAVPVEVEVDAAAGLPKTVLVGLPELAVRESVHRIERALANLGYPRPTGRTIINLAPADLRKDAGAFDLPIALGLLVATGQVKPDQLADAAAVGELALDGVVRPVKGVLSIALAARGRGLKRLLVPRENAREAAVVQELEVYAVSSLAEAVGLVTGEAGLDPVSYQPEELDARLNKYDVDFADVRGQEFAKRAAVIAAAGGHNLLMIGAPGSGKSMLAKRLGTILPPLAAAESLGTTRIHSSTGLLAPGQPLMSASARGAARPLAAGVTYDRVTGTPATGTVCTQFHLVAATFTASVQVPGTCASSIPADAMAEVIRRYRSGETLQAIATSFGVPQKAVRRVLEEFDEPLRTSCPVSGVHRQTILDRHAGGKSIKEISTGLGLNFATVYQVLRRAAGRRRRPTSHAPIPRRLVGWSAGCESTSVSLPERLRIGRPAGTPVTDTVSVDAGDGKCAFADTPAAGDHLMGRALRANRCHREAVEFLPDLVAGLTVDVARDVERAAEEGADEDVGHWAGAWRGISPTPRGEQRG